MKTVALSFLFASFFASQAAFGDEDRPSVRSQYDDLMKSSGSWSFVASSSFTLGVAAAGYSYYAYSKYEGYLSLAKTKTLSAHEEDQERLWLDACNNAGIGSGALLVVSLSSYIFDVHYENRAHAFALDMGVKF